MSRLKLLIGLLIALLLVGWVTVVYVSAFRVGSDIRIERGQTVSRSLFVVGRTVDIAGTVRGNLFCAGRSVVITGKVTGDVVCAGQTVNVLGIVGGSIQVKTRGVSVPSTFSHRESTWLVPYLFMAFFMSALVLVLALPQVFHSATGVAIHSPGRTLLLGFSASILVPVVITIMMATIVGIPLGILALSIWIVLIYVAGPFSAYYAGRLILRRSMNAMAIMTVGSFVLLLLYLVPFLGTVILALSLWFGLGIVLSQAKYIQKPHYGVTYIITPKGRRR